MKKFSILLMFVVALMSLASCGGASKKNAEAQQCEHKGQCLPVGLQLYSVRDDMAKDFKGTLQQVKAMGYDGVEFAGLFDNSPADVKAMCAEIGLNPISAHVPLADMLADVDKVIADYKAIGCEYIVVPYVTEERRPGGDKFNQMIEEIRTIGAKCKEAGLTLLYHNHDFEFAKTESGEFGLDYLYANVSADLLQTELDECWVRYAGQDPVAYLQKYEGRSPVVHLKDYYASGEQKEDPYALIGLNEGEKKENTAFEFRPLGYGVQDVPALMKAAKHAGSKWLIVEQDQPSMGKTPLECVALSMETIQAIRQDNSKCDHNHGEGSCDHKDEKKEDCSGDEKTCSGSCKH
ncbi:MAG: sugar phosphate isomerase/epimerase [Bacteroidaceae bacterium]|nr:sugar phosphate isomerase/epimerase [Bacteroidaceae bacterium]